MLTPRRHRPASRARRGQALVELLLLLPVLLLCLTGAAQLGAILFTGVSVDAASRDGAIAASESPIGSGAYTEDDTGHFAGGTGVTCSSSAPNPANPVCVAWARSQSSLSSLSMTLSPGGSSGSAGACSSGTIPDGNVTVQASATTPIFIPLIGNLFADSPGGGVRTMSDSVTMRVEPCSMQQTGG
jgi:Flp pilus assembly protein TadG